MCAWKERLSTRIGSNSKHLSKPSICDWQSATRLTKFDREGQDERENLLVCRRRTCFLCHVPTFGVPAFGGLVHNYPSQRARRYRLQDQQAYRQGMADQNLR